jgi:hypothetical protein
MKLMNRNNLSIRAFAAKEKSRYSLRAILATEKETVATDGHILARVSLPALDASNFPTVDGFKPNGFTRGLIPLEAAKEIESAIPKKSLIPILLTAAITADHVDTGDGERIFLKVAATDLDTPKVFTVRQPDGQFPQWERIWPTEKPAIDICFDATLLATLAAVASKFSDKTLSPIRLRFYDSASACRFDMVNDDGQEMNGLLMPCRAGVNPTFKPEREPEPEPVAQAAEPEPEPEPVAQAAEPESEPEPVAQAAEPDSEFVETIKAVLLAPYNGEISEPTV